MSTCPTLETPRLVLRPWQEADLEAFLAMLHTEPVRTALYLSENVTRERAWSMLAMWLGEWELRQTGQWAVVEKASQQLVGFAGLSNPMVEGWPGVEVGWGLHPQAWGQGYATEAATRVVTYAWTKPQFTQLFSFIHPDNHRSVAVARRLGFTLLEERVIPTFPTITHGIWWLPRPNAVG